MPDEIDKASDIEDMQRELAINNVRHKAHQIKHHSLHCLYCNDTSQANSDFCSPECRDDYQKEQSIKKIIGSF